MRMPDLDPRNPAEKELAEHGQRIAGEYLMHRLADPIGNLGHFFAVRLSDATSNHNLYPSMDSARADIRKRDDEDLYMYVQIVPANMEARDAALLLRAQRKMYDAGIRTSTMGGRTMIPRMAREDQTAQLRSVFRGTRPTNRRDV